MSVTEIQRSQRRRLQPLCERVQRRLRPYAAICERRSATSCCCCGIGTAQDMSAFPPNEVVRLEFDEFTIPFRENGS